MANIIDYVLWSAPVGERDRPFCEVDSLVLSQLAYLNYGQLLPLPGQGFLPFSQLAQESSLPSLLQGVRAPEANETLIRSLGKSERFRDLQAGNYVNIFDKELQVQFSAVTFLWKGIVYAAFRGTDSTYVGWKEDFNLAFLSPVPSQQVGVEYLNWTASQLSGPLLAGGHSKGGNIAVYASAFCAPETRRRIIAVYSHDGPGFTQGILESPEFAEAAGRVRKTVPQSSLVGMLLQNQENYRVIRSSQTGLHQHDPFSWVVENGEFLTVPELSGSARFLDRNLDAWIASLSEEELSAFADALYQVLCALPGESFADAPAASWAAVRETIAGLEGLSSETTSCLLRTVGSLLTLSLKELPRSAAELHLPELHLPELHLPELLRPVADQAEKAVHALPESFLRRLPFLSGLKNDSGASPAAPSPHSTDKELPET